MGLGQLSGHFSERKMLDILQNQKLGLVVYNLGCPRPRDTQP